MRKFLFYFVLFTISVNYSQEKEDLFNLISKEEKKIELLPERMIFTQSLLWGKKGLLRKTGISELNLDNRQKELRLRKSMLTAHQAIG